MTTEPALAPRLLTVREVCRLLRRTSGWFYAHRGDLEKAGFPKPLPVVDRYDSGAILAWVDLQGARTEQSPIKDKILGRFTQWGKSA